MINLWYISFFILLPVSVFSQNLFTEKDEKKELLLPGKIALISFNIENTSEQNKIYDIAARTADPTIEAVIRKDSIEVLARESKVYILPVKVSSKTAAGKYQVTLILTDRTTNSVIEKHSQIVVSSIKNISLHNIEAPQYLRAGQVLRASFQIKNQGNVAEYLRFETNADLIEGIDTVHLQPGEVRIIEVVKNTDINLPNNDIYYLRLTAHSLTDSLSKWHTGTHTTLISVKPASNDIYHRLPVYISGAYIGMQDKGVYSGGFQGEIRGSGSLNNKNSDLLSFRAVSPNPVKFNIFTQYEEYFINYKNDRWYVHLGDKVYASSMLTEFSRYGRGAALQYRFKNVSLGGFYNHPRFFVDIRDEFNVYSTVHINKEDDITAGYLYKIPQDDSTKMGYNAARVSERAHLPYVKANIQSLKYFKILAEASYSHTGMHNGSGYMVQLQSHYLKSLSGNLSYIKTSPFYAGYFSNASMFNGYLRYLLSKRITLSASYVQDAKNIQRDTFTLSVPYREYQQYGARYKYAKHGALSLLSGIQRYQDRLEPKLFDYREAFARVTIEQKMAFLNFNVEGQLGRTTNYLLGYKGTSQYYTTNLSFQKLKTSFNLFASYMQTARYQLKEYKTLYYGIRTFSRFSDNTQLGIFYQNNYQPEEYYADRNLMEVSLHQRLSSKHYLDLSGRYVLQRGETGKKDFIVSLKCTYRLNIPVQKTASYTSLYGNVRNLGVAKTEGLRLMLGNHIALTDRFGNYIFKNVVPGDYVLEIDRTSININDIPDVQLPVPLQLSGKENVFNFGMTVASSIKGMVKVEERNASPIAFNNNKDKNYGVIIEASNGKEVYRKICLFNKPFDFTYLRPGTWDIKVYPNGWEKEYKIITGAQSIVLKAGDMQYLDIIVVRQRGEIKYQQESIKITYQGSK